MNRRYERNERYGKRKERRTTTRGCPYSETFNGTGKVPSRLFRYRVLRLSLVRRKPLTRSKSSSLRNCAVLSRARTPRIHSSTFFFLPLNTLYIFNGCMPDSLTEASS